MQGPALAAFPRRAAAARPPPGPKPRGEKLCPSPERRRHRESLTTFSTAPLRPPARPVPRCCSRPCSPQPSSAKGLPTAPGASSPSDSRSLRAPRSRYPAEVARQAASAAEGAGQPGWLRRRLLRRLLPAAAAAAVRPSLPRALPAAGRGRAAALPRPGPARLPLTTWRPPGPARACARQPRAGARRR